VLNGSKMWITNGPVAETLVVYAKTTPDAGPRAPRSLIETTLIFRESDVARDWFGDDFVDHFAATREWEWRQWQDAVTDWELRRYFEII
jgi:glutamine synthetase